MKVIFLDFDGVLNSDNFVRYLIDLGYTFDERRWKFDLRAIRALNGLIEQTGAKVVISSSWRKNFTVGQLQYWLRAYGFKGEVIGKTPTLRGEKENSPGVRYERGDEIQDWITNSHFNGENSPEVESFVILDDDTDMAHLYDRLVKIDCLTGLTTDYSQAIISILNRKCLHENG